MMWGYYGGEWWWMLIGMVSTILFWGTFIWLVIWGVKQFTGNRLESSEGSSRVVFPDFQVSRTLPAFGITTMEFTPDKSGEFGFACGMNMLHGTLIVAISVGVILIYGFLILSTRSLVNPLVILTSLPLAAVGGLVALAISARSISLSSPMGVLTLALEFLTLTGGPLTI